MSKHKKQHYIPACYLKAWRDPHTPASQTPYVWVFDKDGSNVRKKAPENIFYETDLYTIHRANDSRDLVLEKGLSQLETEFTRIRNSKISYKRPVEESEHVLLCAFTAAAHARTPSSREHHRKQWEKPLRKMEKMMEWVKTATPEQKKRLIAMYTPFPDSKEHITYEQVKQMHDNPLQTMLFSMIQIVTERLCKLDFAIFVTNDEIGFLTSDNPCVWFDPEAYKRPPLYRGPGIIYKTIEITIPLSPFHTLFFNRQGISGYIDAIPEVVDELNRRVRFSAENYFVARQNVRCDYWFELGVEPDDSWDNQHARKMKNNKTPKNSINLKP
ncbi:MAG: hypothetical protein NMNS01_25990 [Nitrosomonas sp.]|nr:MAG: hypothetical protein NMNS01_25990 [Nitrosomonas sp.]